MDEIHVHKTKKSICAHFAESPCNSKVKNLGQGFVAFNTAWPNAHNKIKNNQ